MLHYASLPNKDVALVLLHGFCENNTCFNNQVLLLKNHCNLVIPNLPGTHQGSNIPADMNHMAQLVWDELKTLPYKQFILIGHSMGGYLALAMYNQHALKVTGLGLLHSTALPDSDERKLMREQAKNIIEQKGSSFFVKQFIPPLFYTHQSLADVAALQQQADSFFNEGLVAQVNCMKNREDYSYRVTQFSIPVFFGIGKYDTLIPQAVILAQAASCQKSYVAYLAQSAHMGHLEQPDLLAKHLLNFYNQIT